MNDLTPEVIKRLNNDQIELLSGPGDLAPLKRRASNYGVELK